MSNLTVLADSLATQLGMTNGGDVLSTLKSTVFKGPVSDAQMTALLIVAKQYSLNPWTRELFAFPDKQNGIVPVVSVDGWSRIINSRPEFDGMEFEQTPESCTCIIHRKDRSHPTKVTEWMAECSRGTGPWASHPYRMLRHKAMIQCARLAFGFAGIYEQDEAERIVEAQAPKKVDPDTGEITSILFDVTAALDAIEACTTAEEWNAVYKAEGAKAVAAKDLSGQKVLKAAAAEKRAQLIAESNIVDVEAK